MRSSTPTTYFHILPPISTYFNGWGQISLIGVQKLQCIPPKSHFLMLARVSLSCFCFVGYPTSIHTLLSDFPVQNFQFFKE